MGSGGGAGKQAWVCLRGKRWGSGEKEREAGRGDTYGVTPVRKYLFPTEISSRRWKLGSRASSGKSIECQRGKTACQDYVMGLVFLPDIATHLIHTKNVNVLAHCSRITRILTSMGHPNFLISMSHVFFLRFWYQCPNSCPNYPTHVFLSCILRQD